MLHPRKKKQVSYYTPDNLPIKAASLCTGFSPVHKVAAMARFHGSSIVVT